jgi:hypothetical protein
MHHPSAPLPEDPILEEPVQQAPERDPQQIQLVGHHPSEGRRGAPANRAIPTLVTIGAKLEDRSLTLSLWQLVNALFYCVLCRVSPDDMVHPHYNTYCRFAKKKGLSKTTVRRGCLMIDVKGQTTTQSIMRSEWQNLDGTNPDHTARFQANIVATGVGNMIQWFICLALTEAETFQEHGLSEATRTAIREKEFSEIEKRVLRMILFGVPALNQQVDEYLPFRLVLDTVESTTEDNVIVKTTTLVIRPAAAAAAAAAADMEEDSPPQYTIDVELHQIAVIQAMDRRTAAIKRDGAASPSSATPAAAAATLQPSPSSAAMPVNQQNPMLLDVAEPPSAMEIEYIGSQV